MKKQFFLNIAFAVSAMYLLASCSGLRYYYQVYEVMSEDVPIVGDQFVFDNDDLLVRYDFCREGGDMTFYCYNKSNRIIYLQLDNSFYIHNGIAYDYYKDSEYTTTISTASGTQASKSSSQSLMAGVAGAITGLVGVPGGYNLGTVGVGAAASVSRTNELGYYSSSSRSQSITEHAVKVIAIPPHFAKYIDGFTIQNAAIMKCGAEMYNENYPKKSSTIFNYTQETSPINFSNHISYSFNQDGSDLQCFVNNFYVGSIQNKAEDEVKEKNPKYKENFNFDDQNDACATNHKYFFKITSPTMFYNVFSKKKY